MQVKIRVIANQKSGEPILGLTIPKELAMFTKINTLYYIERSGTSFILTSGCAIIPPSKEQIEKYKFEDCRVL